MKASSDKNILIIVTRAVVGGAQTSVLNLARELQRRSENVTVAFGDGEWLEGECKKEGIPTHRFAWLGRTYNPFANLFFIFEARRFIKQKHFTTVHINSSNALFAAVAAKLVPQKPKTIFTFHGLSLLEETARDPLMLKVVYALVLQATLRWVDECVFVSERNYVDAKAHHIVNKGHIIFNGIELGDTLLSRKQARAWLETCLGKRLPEFIVGSIGRLDTPKNYEFLIDALAQLPAAYRDLRVLLLGDGPERAFLLKRAQDKGVCEKVLFAGGIPNAATYMKAFDVFVLPSRFEGFSISLTEALHVGVPVLASDVGGAREQFAHALFQVFPLNDHQAFNERLIRLYEHPELRQELAVGNSAHAAQFSTSKQAQEYLQIYS